MAFSGRSSGGTMSDINVTPLVDVMLVLLIIFMVATPMMQRGIDVNIPVARQTAPLVSERLFVTVPLSYRQNRIVYIDDAPVRVELLEERVRQSLINKTGKEVFLRGDGGVQLKDVLEVMDRLKSAGVEKVGIVAKLPGER